MPNKTNLEIIKQQLPLFVKMLDETYKGRRYKAKFIDLEYNQEFEAIVDTVIRLKHGCPQRANDLRSKKLRGKNRNRTSVEVIKKRLPKHLEIIEESYNGMGNKAIFYDKEYNTYLIAYVFNVLRTQKGYCKERFLDEFRKQVNIPVEEIEKRLYDLFGGSLKLKRETYVNVNSMATFIKNGAEVRYNVSQVLNEKFGSNMIELNKWRKQIILRDIVCQICQKNTTLQPHHLYSWHKHPRYRFDLAAGVLLCKIDHLDFHARFGQVENTPQQFLEFLKQKENSLENLADTIKQRLNIL